MDLNALGGMEEEGQPVGEQRSGINVGVYQDGEVHGEDTVGAGQSGTQDLDLFELGPIIAVVSRESRQWKRHIAEVVEEVEVLGGEDSSVQHKKAFIISKAEETSREGSPRSP